MSGPQMFAADPLKSSKFCCGASRDHTGSPAQPTDALEPSLLCVTARYRAERGHRDQGITFPWKGLHGLQQCLDGGWYISKDGRNQRFPSRTWPKPSQSLSWLLFFPECILVPRAPQVSCTHALSHQRDVHQTRPPSSFTPWSSSDVLMPVVGALGS